MPTITFQPSGKSISVPNGTALIDAAREAGLDISAPCGGEGMCGKCRVQALEGNLDSQYTGILSESLLNDGYVLACKARILDSNLTVSVPREGERKGVQFAEDRGDRDSISGDLFPGGWKEDPLTVKLLVEIAPPQAEDGLSDWDRLTNALQNEFGKKEFCCGLPILQKLPETIRENQGIVTATLYRNGEIFRIINIEAGDKTARHFGIAVDVGTTTVAVQLIDLTAADILATRVDYNDQVGCGLDVISRINYAARPDRLKELRDRVLQTINCLTQEVAESRQVDPSEICGAVVSGNTTMMHLLLGIKPEYIRLEPYTPAVYEFPSLTANEVGIAIHPQSPIILSPCVGSYVGGDITAGLLCTDLAEEICLFIDIGTNGEIVIGNRDFLMACACSAGPAFEGGGIDCGMRAATGAIESVEVDPQTGVPSCLTISGGKPQGICGSGMICLLAELFRTGWIDAAGQLDRARESKAIQVNGRQASYILAAAEDSATGEPVAISENDIKNIIRAKAAIYSACALMLEQAGLTFSDVARLYIAGSFGRFLDLEKASTIGMLPAMPHDKNHSYIGNASLTGSYLALASRTWRQRQLDLSRGITYIDLSNHPSYMDQYTAALFLPHTDPSAFSFKR